MTDYALAGGAALMIFGMVSRAANGFPVPPVALVAPMLLVGVWLVHSKMTTSVYADRILLEFGWLPIKLVRLVIPIDEVKSCEPVLRQPLWSRAKTVCICRSKAVELITTRPVAFLYSTRIAIGTGRPVELSDAINGCIARTPTVD